MISIEPLTPLTAALTLAIARIAHRYRIDHHRSSSIIIDQPAVPAVSQISRVRHRWRLLPSFTVYVYLFLSTHSTQFNGFDVRFIRLIRHWNCGRALREAA